MDWTCYLFGFQGRINRAKYWLAGLVLIGWILFIACLIYLFVELLAAGYLPAGPVTFHFGVDTIFGFLDPATYRYPSRADIVPAMIHVIGTPVFLWIYLATSIKRLHDRDKSGWWMVPYFVLPGLVTQFSDRLDGYDPYGLTALAAGLLYLWGGIEMYFLKGSPWPNRFGPNPLGKQPSRPRSAHAGAGGTGWAQESGIEFVPHKSSPPPLSHVKPGA